MRETDVGEKTTRGSRITYLDVQGFSVDGGPVPSRDSKADPIMSNQNTPIPSIIGRAPSLYEFGFEVKYSLSY